MEQTYIPGELAPVGEHPDRSMLIDQAVQMLGVSKRTVYYWIRDGRLRTIRARCGSQRVLLSSIRDVRDQMLAASRLSSSDSFSGFTS